MDRADQLLQDGDLDTCRATLIDLLKREPGNERARMFYAQLLCVIGEWEKAKGQFTALAKLSPAAQMLAVAYGQAIDAEAVRASVFSGQARSEMLVDSDWAVRLPEAIEAYARGEVETGDAIRDAVFDDAPDVSGRFDGIEFDWMADGDGRFGPCFEAIIAGRYGLVPMDAVAEVKSEGPKDLRDVVWYPVELLFKTGQSTAAFIPARYPGSETAPDADIQLGRSTDWPSELPGGGALGQRLWTLSDGSEQSILSLRRLTFD